MKNTKIDDRNDAALPEALAPANEFELLEKEAADFVLTATDDDGHEYGPDHVPGELIDWSRMRRPLRPRIWFVKGWLSTVPTLFAARGGIGKSIETQTMCTAIATGKDYIGVVDQPRTCLIWSCEDDPDEICRRQFGINKHFGVTDGDLKRLHMNPRIGLENTVMELVNGKLTATPVLKLLREQVNDLRADVLVLDNVAHLYGGLDDRTQVTKFVNAITGMVTGRPFAPIFVTHVSKVLGSEYAGSIAWENAVRMRWFLQSAEDGDLLQTVGKSNISAKTSINLRILNGVMVPKSAREVAEAIRKDKAEKTKRDEHVEAILIDGFEMLRASETKVCAKQKSPDSIAKLIWKHGYQKDASKQELNDATDRLELAKCIETGADGKYVNGSPYIAITKIHPIARRASLPAAA